MLLMLAGVIGTGCYILLQPLPVSKPVSNPGSIPVYCMPSLDPEKLKDDHGPLVPSFTLVKFPFTSQSDSARLFFDQGLSQLYAFNHGEAGRSFRTAIRLDPGAAMSYWGLAMVLGPNYNAALDPGALSAINESVQKAVSLSGKASPLEKELITALAKRFPVTPPQDMSAYNAAYAAAMEQLYARYPENAEVAVLYIDALMNEHPWNLWLKDGKAQPWTPKIVRTIEAVLSKWPAHIGAIHYYIHATEASGNAGVALPYADKLGQLAPGNGHLLHMPSHTYIRTGDYHKGVVVNEAAVLSDSNYINQCKASGFYPMLLYPHNIHFLAACAFLEGSTEKAMKAAWLVSANADKKNLDKNVTVQHYYIIPYYMMVHLGKWDEILRLPMPGESLVYPRAIWHYARGMALANRKAFPAAEKELEHIRKILDEKVLQKQLIWDLNTAADLAGIGYQVLKGELRALQGNYDEAIPCFQEAVALEDRLNYNEPPDWFFSARHSLGHWLIRAGNPMEAASVYEKDLLTFPENGWALKGLYNAQIAQGMHDAASKTAERFEKAWKWADIGIGSSRHFE